MSPNHSIVDNTAIELAIHLAAVLLTGTHLLVMPLKQLGLSPENMQVNIYLCRTVKFTLFQLLSNDRRMSVVLHTLSIVGNVFKLANLNVKTSS